MKNRVLTGLSDGLFGVGLHGLRLVALGVHELVVDDLNAGIVGRQEGDLVGNSLGIGESGDVLADVGEAHHDGAGAGTRQLSLGLVAENHDVGIGGALESPASGLAETGVDTTAETLVGAGNDEQSLLILEGLGFGLLEKSVGGLTVGTGVGHGLLSASQTGRGNDLHSVGDLLDVLDGLETAFDFTQGRKVGGIGGRGASRTVSYPSPVFPQLHSSSGACAGSSSRRCVGGRAVGRGLTG